MKNRENRFRTFKLGLTFVICLSILAFLLFASVSINIKYIINVNNVCYYDK